VEILFAILFLQLLTQQLQHNQHLPVDQVVALLFQTILVQLATFITPVMTASHLVQVEMVQERWRELLDFLQAVAEEQPHRQQVLVEVV
jgi:hypothetical protein